MKGDYSRFTHDPDKHYTGVLKQQGRVDLDADWNEDVAIRQHLARTTRADVIGRCGTPEGKVGGDAFRISAPTLIDVTFAPGSSDHGWAIGENGTLLITIDGGDAWTPRPLPEGVAGRTLYDLCFLDANTGWIVGEDGLILCTTDGGETWVKQNSSTGATLYGVFITETEGWAVGAAGTLLRLDRSTGVWAAALPVAVETFFGSLGLDEWPELSSVCFVGDCGCIVGQYRTILVKRSASSDWALAEEFSSEDAPDRPHLFSVAAHLGGPFWAVGAGGTVLTADPPGETWATPAECPNLSDVFLRDVHASPGGGIVTAVGTKGEVLLFDAEALPEGAFSRPGAPTILALGGVYCTNERICVVGQDGLIFVSTDLGAEWISRHNLFVSPGRYYVDGFLCELDRQATYHAQPDLPGAPEIAAEPGQTSLVYLDVWERNISVAEDPGIREVALGGPDTTTRVRTIAQIKLTPVEGAEACDALGDWRPSPSSARLSTDVAPTEEIDDPCLLAPSGGYQGLENRLYRVEIHDGSNGGAPTYKWSRDNGSVAFAIGFDAEPNKVVLRELGKDQILALNLGDWIEVVTDETVLKEKPGTLAEIVGIDTSRRILTLSKDVSAHASETHPKAIRWDQKSDVIEVPFGGAVHLEDGVYIEFSGDRFHSGDYWTFAARAIVGTVDRLAQAPPHGITHHYCPLALIAWGDETDHKVQDCRHRFPSLGEQLRFFHVGGTGQEAMPGGTLPQPLEVGVANSQWPIEGARVRFSIEPSSDGGQLDAIDSSGTSVETTTDARGIATCKWTPGLDTHSQRAIATLLAPSGEPIEGIAPLAFNANLSVASHVAYAPSDPDCSDLAGATTVQEALDRLCARPTGGHDPYLALRYLGGDGQEGVGNDPEVGYFKPLPCLLRVGVEDENGRPPLCDETNPIRVRFKCDTAGDRIRSSDDTTPPVDAVYVDVEVDDKGIAEAAWFLGPVRDSCHTVKTWLLGPSGAGAFQVRFHATVRPEAQAEDPNAWPQVVGISWTNDRDMPTGQFMENGIVVYFSHDMQAITLNPSTFIASIELPEGGWGDRPMILRPLGDTIGKVDQFTYAFKPTQVSLDGRFGELAESGRPQRIRCRIVLKGDKILSSDDQLPLDGNVRGILRQDNTGTWFIDLDLSSGSGDGVRGGDFESWFFLVP